MNKKHVGSNFDDFLKEKKIYKLEWFHGEVETAGDGGYQTLINAAFREYITSQQEPIEVILR